MKSTIHRISMTLLLSLLLALPSGADVEQGLEYLLGRQNTDGSWGDDGALRPRDTAVVLETLRRFGNLGPEFRTGRSFLDGNRAKNLDFGSRGLLVDALAQGGGDMTSLWSARRPLSFDPSAINFPEGGWGLAPGFQTDVLDTSLALQALAAAGYAGGFQLAGHTLGVSQEQVFTIDTPSNATSASVWFQTLSIVGGSGNVNVWMVGPGGRFPEAGWYQFTAGGQSLPWDDVSTPPFAPGLIEIHLRTDAASLGAATFDLNGSLVAAGIDSLDLAEPLEYLRLARNTGAGWGLLVGSESDLFASLHALAALQTYDRAFDTESDVNPGIAWVKSQVGAAPAGETPIYQTALAYIVLAGDDPNSPEAAGQRVALEAAQLANGSWNDDPYETALALKALPWGEADTDGDLVRDPFDNCSEAANVDQLDTDLDGLGNPCDEDDDNDGVPDAIGGEPSTTPFLALDITGMTGTLPAQPANAFLNFVVFDGVQDNMGWWDATNRAWIDDATAPVRRPLLLFVDPTNCLCIDMTAGDTLTAATDNGNLTIHLPDQAPGWQGWLYLADDGSTYYDPGLTSLAQGAVAPGIGDNCPLSANPEQYDLDEDGTGDACDPDDGEVARLWALGDGATWVWTGEIGAVGYNVYRGSLSLLGPSNYGDCWLASTNRDADLDGNPDATDTEVPLVGEGYFYLATGVQPGGEGSRGRDSAGNVRNSTSFCP